MPAPIVVTLNPNQIQVKPGQQATATVVIRNRTEEVGHYLLRIENLPAGWAEVTPDQVSAFPLQETRSQVVLHPPADAQGATYPAIVRVTSQEDPAVEGWAALELTLPATVVPPTFVPTAPPPQREQPPATPQAGREAGGQPTATPRTSATPFVAPPPRVEPRPITATQIQVRAEPVANPNLPPPALQWRLMLRNAGNILDTFSFSLSGIRPEWVSMDPTQVTLKPDEEGTALLTVRPGDDTPAGAYPFTLRAFSQINLSQRTELALKVEVQPRAGFSLALTPPETEAQGAREFAVSLTSAPNSNTDLQFDLSASDAENACDYTFEPAQVLLAARSSARSTLRVRPRAILGPQERRTYTFKVVATPRGSAAPAQSGEARLTQVSTPPPTLGLRPQVQSGDLEATYTLLITNPSSVELPLRLAAADPEAGCEYRFETPQLTVPPRGNAQVRLVVAARGYGEAEKTFPFSVSATRVGELVPVAKTDGRFVQKPVSPVTMSLVPTQQSSAGRVRYRVQVTNPRLRPVQLALEAKDEADALTFAFSPPEVQLSAGAEGGAWLTVRPKDKLLQGEQRRVHHFKINAQVAGSAAPLTVEGTLAQVRGFGLGGSPQVLIKIAKWVVAAVVLLFIAALALTGMETLTETTPKLGDLFYPIITNPVVRFVLRLPVAAPARAVVHWIRDLISLLNSAGR